MAIHNASDLLVYAKTTNPEKQVTRIYVKTTDPLEIPDGSTQGNVIINNVTNNLGEVRDGVTTNNANNTAASLISQISIALVTDNNYTQNAQNEEQGDYTYREFTNGTVGLVPTLEIVSGTAILNEDAIIIEVITPGSSAIFDPVAFSTSASLSVNRDLRDITNKDSGGWSESMPGLKSFEISTESLQSINPDTPLDGSDFFDKLKNGTEVNLSYSDRIRNIIRTNLTQSAIDGFSMIGGLTQTNLQDDPFGGSTASALYTGGTQTSGMALRYAVDASRLQGKKVTFSLYLKGFGLTTSAMISIQGMGFNSIGNLIPTIEGPGSISHSAGIYRQVTGLSSTSFTRVSLHRDVVDINQGESTVYLYVYPNSHTSQNNEILVTSSWQIEFSNGPTDYQDPTDITHWQGNALVSSLSFDSGVEDNLTCSATFTGTGNIYPNGLGPELISDTGFDNPSYWTVVGASLVENGYGKILFTSGGSISYIQRASLMNPGDFYLLTYTVSNAVNPTGRFIVHNGWEQDGSDGQTVLPKSVGTHQVLIKAGSTFLQLKRQSTTITTTVWLSSISLRKVL